MSSVSRRSALKLLAAAVMAPTIQLRQSVPDEQLLLAFCHSSETHHRYNIEKPFGVGALTYATDAKAVIRCELAGRIEDGERRLPDVLSVWENYKSAAPRWRQLTPDDLRPTEFVNGSCPECGDRRVSFGEEYPTDETAAFELPDWDVDDNSIRDISCPLCHGREYSGPSCVRICGVLHSSWDLRRIVALPNPTVCHSVYHGDLRQKVILFRADGFEGISVGVVK